MIAPKTARPPMLMAIPHPLGGSTGGGVQNGSPGSQLPNPGGRPILFLRDRAEVSELRYSKVDAALDGWRVLLAGVKFLGERAVVADEENVLLIVDHVAVCVEGLGVPDPRHFYFRRQHGAPIL